MPTRGRVAPRLACVRGALLFVKLFNCNLKVSPPAPSPVREGAGELFLPLTEAIDILVKRVALLGAVLYRRLVVIDSLGRVEE